MVRLASLSVAAVVAVALSGCFILHAAQGREFRVGVECQEDYKGARTAEDLRRPLHKACEWVRFHRVPRELVAGEPLDDAIAFVSTPRTTDSQIAHAYDVVTQLDRDAIRAAIAKLPKAVAATLRDDFESNRRAVIRRVEGESQRWRDVFLGPAVRARAAWRRRSNERGPWQGKADAMLARIDDVELSGGDVDRVLEELTALHRAYVAACRRGGAAVEACLGDEIGRPLAKALLRTARLAKREQLASADLRFLEVPDQSSAAVAEREAAQAALRAEARERTAWENARARGLDPEAIRRRWPVEPFDVDPGEVVRFGSSRRDEMVRAGGGQYQVERVERRGDTAVLHFRRWVTGGYVATGCYETNKVLGYAHGRVIYDERCTGRKWMTKDHTAKPATVPWREVASVRRFEVVRLVLDEERAGHVVEVMAGNAKTPRTLGNYRGELLQIRDIRIARPRRAR